MSERKRKRESQGKNERAHKKIASSVTSPDTVNITLLQDVNEWTPLLAFTPGLKLPPKISFKPYTKPRPQKPRSTNFPKEILLHSSNHPKLDYVAQETETENGDTFLNHYVGVYDPSQDTLQLVPARKVIIRSAIKTMATTSPDTDEEEENHTSVPNDVSARNTLGLTFGTKKSQKAIRSLTENDIVPTRPGAALDPLASAVMDSMAASTADMPSSETIQAEAISNKPIPTPNLEAETPAEVYTLDDLVGMQTLRSMQVKEWIDKENDGEEVITRSRFVSARIARMVKAEEVKELKALKYLLLLIEWYLALKKTGQNSSATLEVPKKEQWESVLPGWNNAAIAAVERRFTERGNVVLNRWHTNLLLTHILALALVIDDCNVDVHDIREDLHLDNKQISTLYSELAAPLSAPTEAQLKKLRLSKSDALKSGHRIACLKLPLKFPKVRIVRASGSRR